MRLNKFFLLLCALMFAMVLAACSGDSKPTDSKSDDGKKGSNDDESAQVDYYQTPEMDFDMGGRTIKWVSWYSEEIPEDNPDNIKKKENLEALMEKHNFSIEWVVVDYGEYQEKVTTSLLAGQPIGDIIRFPRPWMIPTLTKQDLFWPVDEYTKNDHVFIQQYTHDYSLYEGRGYGFRTGINGASSGIFYNRTLMEDLGLTPLQEYVDNDNWSWDTFIEVAKSANKDTNNDGELDVWGLATDALIVPALAANEANLVYEDKHGLEDPKTVETLNFLSRLATEDVARPTEGGDWTEPKQFFMQGNTLMYSGSDYEMDDFKADMPDYDIGFVPFPKGPSSEGYRSFVTIPNYLTIPKAVENPDQLVYIYEKINDIQSMYDYPKQASLESLFTKEEDIENARIAGEVINVVDNINGYPTMPYYEFEGEIREGTSISTIIEKYKDPFQASIDEVWKD
nr:extracellular solute-binding protein [Paenibacillus bovis]